MISSTTRWLLLVAMIVTTLTACGVSSVQLGEALEAPDGTRYYWTTGESSGSRCLWRASRAVPEPVMIDQGVFENVIGPLLSTGGAAWGRLTTDGWTVHQVGVSDAVERRGQGVADALSAAWLVERLASGHSPGNAADLIQVGEVARSGRWPR